MMGRSHCATGAVAGLAAAPLLELDVAATALFAAVTAGFALLPDLDHPRATVSRLVGPLTGLLSRGLRALSAAVYQATKGPRDERCSGTHRHLSHTLAFAVALGVLTAVGTSYGGRWAVLGVVAFGVVLAADALGDWVLMLGAGLGGWAALSGDVWAALDGAAGWVGVAVALGCFVHCLGDSLTLSGCPWLWPVPIAGETWWEIRPPRLVRFRTGGAVEQVVFGLTVVAGVVLLPGVAPLVLPLVAEAWAALHSV